MLPIVRIWVLGFIALLATVLFIGYSLDVSQYKMLDKARFSREILARQFATEIDRYLAEEKPHLIPQDQDLRDRLTLIVDRQRFSSSYQELALTDLILSLSFQDEDIYLVRHLSAGRGEGVDGSGADRLSTTGPQGPLPGLATPVEDDNLRSTVQLTNLPLRLNLSQSPEEIRQLWQRDALPVSGVGLGFGLMILLLTVQATRYQRFQSDEMETLRLQAYKDSLTDLYNRRYTEEQALLEIKKAKRNGTDLSIILLDLDYFKSINDCFGHVTGDQVLVSTAQILKEICRETDLVCRYGGEEFLLVLPGTALSGAQVIAEKVRVAIESNGHCYANQRFQITASFGVSQWNSTETDFLDVLRRADAALYEVKSIGRNQIKVFRAGDPCSNPSATTRLYWGLDRA